MKELIDQYAAYNLWANTRMAERLQRESEALLIRHVKSSFPSMQLTVHHLSDSTNAWYARIFGVGPIPAQGDLPGLVKLSVAMKDKVLAATLEELLEPVHYARSNGNAYEQPRWQLLVHCFNHSTYHRGQLVTIMRQLDLPDIPGTDLVAYQRLLQKG